MPALTTVLWIIQETWDRRKNSASQNQFTAVRGKTNISGITNCYTSGKRQQPAAQQAQDTPPP